MQFGFGRAIAVVGLCLGAISIWQPLTAGQAAAPPSYANEFHDHASSIQAVASLPEQGVLATGDGAGVVYLWRLTQDSSALGATLQQEGSGIGLATGTPLPGAVRALAFGDARCNGPDKPSVPNCGPFVGGVSATGFSYLQVYDWQRQQLLAERQNLHGTVEHLAVTAGGGIVAACFGENGIHRLSVDYHGRTAERGVGSPFGVNCTWVGYAAGNTLRFAAEDQLRVATPADKDTSEAILDDGARTAFAFNAAANTPVDAAVGRKSKIELYGYHKRSDTDPDPALANSPKRLLAKIPTANRYGVHGVEALTWMSIAGREYLLSAGRYTGPGAAEAVTHQVERWRVNAKIGTSTTKKPPRLRGGNFNELISLQASARSIQRLDAPWLQLSDTDRYRYVVIFFALEARPYAMAQLRIATDGDHACLWPAADISPLTFYSDGRSKAGCALSRPSNLSPGPVAIHRSDDTVQIAPAVEPLDFPGSRLQAYTRSINGDSLFAALAAPPEHASGPAELRRYALRADRWVLEGAPAQTDGQVVALTLFGNGQLGVATRTDTASGGTYSVALRGADASPPALPLKVFHFAPVADDPQSFALCLDIADPQQALALYQDNGQRVHIGAPAADRSRTNIAPDQDAARAHTLTSDPAPDCATSPTTPGMMRYRMTVRLPFAMDGEAKLALLGERAKYYIVNFNRPRLYVLAIGINNYKDNRWRLNYAVNDASSFALQSSGN